MALGSLEQWQQILPLLPQFGLVILFMYYQERSDKRLGEAREKQHTEWREFMRVENEKHRASIEKLTLMVSAMNATLVAHDIRLAPVVEDVERIRERLAQAGIGKVDDSPLPTGKKNDTRPRP